jgi:cyclase
MTVPMIASGGAGKLEHFYEGVTKGAAQILLAASVFHYRIFSIRQVNNTFVAGGCWLFFRTFIKFCR